MTKPLLALLAASLSLIALGDTRHTFGFGGTKGEDFLLDGKPFQIRGGELDPGRVPAEYWRHRIRMAKAMGLNTIAPYIFWNDHERTEGKFDFKSESRNIGQFLKICKDEGMWVLLRPGPYVCGEWDGGGLPSYLWKYPDTKFRSLDDKRYTDAVARYLHELAKVVKPNLVTNGGSVVMLQIENEYGSYPRHDHNYIVWLRDQWVKEGINVPFSTSDGPSVNMLKDSILPGAAVGLDSGLSEADWTLARKMNPGVPVFSGETYPGWLRHWGEKDWEPTNVSGELKFYMDSKKSFSLYLVHGGTNFGFTTGANHGGKGYEPDLTSYDYGSPIDEQGHPRKEFFLYRELIASYLPKGALPEVPKPIPTMTIPPIEMKAFNALMHTHSTYPREESDMPKTFEELGQNQGLVLYRAAWPKFEGQTLTFDRLNDIAYVRVEHESVGRLERRLGEKQITLPNRPGSNGLNLDIIVEGMGRINYSGAMDTDRKGISGVKVGGIEVKDWSMYRMPLDDMWLSRLEREDFAWEPNAKHNEFAIEPGEPFPIYRGEFQLQSRADSYLDMRQYKRGVIWVNGHKLGRFWNIGPQYRLYCPASWLKIGKNVITVLDMDGTVPEKGRGPTIEGFEKP